MNNQIQEHVIWWNSLIEDKKQEINRLHFTCEYGKESDFDIHRAFVNLVIKQEQEHLFWWNSLSIETRDKLSQTHYDYESSHFLLDEQILYIYEKVKNHKPVVNVKELKAKEESEKRMRKYDRLTTLLGLTTTLRDFFEISRFLGEGLFKQGLKQKAKIFEDELIATMERYYAKDDREKPKKETKEQLEKRLEEKKERNELQMNQLNNLSVILEQVVSTVCQISEWDDTKCNKYLKEQEKLFKKYNIFHGALLAHLNNEQK